MNELTITRRDWLGVFATGTLFSAFLSMLAYYLLGMGVIEGGLFGVVLGFFIALYSLVFITAMNRYLLPRLTRALWNPIALVFSFLSGFLGTMSTYVVLVFLPLPTVELFRTDPLSSASIIGALTYLMGSLMYRLVKTRNEKEEKEALFVQSRLRSLETQLNPHFLFNALNSLSELVHQNPAKAEEMIVKLSHFLRNTMGEKALIPLSEELRNVRDYIELESLRFSTIALQIDADEGSLNTLVPKFSIQLLCENAIKHGFRGGTGAFIISIRATRGEELSLRVSNNGAPITREAFGIGLSNLQERLSHLCGGALRLESNDPITYLITLKVCHENINRR
jgi:two-component system, LytTR family, sensor kinase